MTTATKCDWLDKKHTIFGKIEGETIYNLVKMSELEVDSETDRPICDPVPRIERAIVVDSPFDDIVPRQLQSSAVNQTYTKTAAKDEQAVKKKTFANKAIKNKNLISFADEEDGEDGDEPIIPKRRGIRAQQDIEGSKQAKKIISDEQLAALKKKREAAEKAKIELAAKIK